MAVSRRARMHAGRVIAGSGAQEPGPRGGGAGPIRHPALPNFGGGGMGGGGYTGIEGILAALQGGINQNQFTRLEQGHTGGRGWGGVGGMNGALSGLSPYATHFLSSLFEKKAAEHQSLTDASGAALTGDALWKAQLMNNLADQNAAANPQYQLHSGVDAGFLQQLFGQGFGGHSAYEKGFGAEGAMGGPRAGFLPPRHRPFRPGGVIRRPLR